MIRLMVFSTDSTLRHSIASAVGTDFEVTLEKDPQQLPAALENRQCDVAMVDFDAEYATPEWQEMLLSSDGPAVVLLAGDEFRDQAADLVRRGAYHSLRKPPSLRELKSVAAKAYEHISMRRLLTPAGSAALPSPPAAQAPLFACDALIGESSAMCNVYSLIRRVTDLNASVLVAGESGTGKELIARAIHNLGSRRKKPFVAVSCGAIPETLIESELFGHEKGAFTGSVSNRIGFFEQVAEGTLFLDEIGELSLQTQVKLLRVLQEREFSRLGSNRAIPFKARIVFATHRNLSRMITEGKFRLDLYYRINVMTITSPALADRAEDIPLLAQHFLERYSDLFQKPVTRLSLEALASLENYDWPGNVRELENAIQSAIICCDGETIRTQDLPPFLREREDTLPAQGDHSMGCFEQLVSDFKVRIAMKAIEDCNGNKSMAAARLNISRAYLHRLIRPAEVATPHAAA